MKSCYKLNARRLPRFIQGSLELLNLVCRWNKTKYKTEKRFPILDTHMSVSPIVQAGNLIAAVIHVLQRSLLRHIAFS